jgi:hypothetical protein
VRAVSDSTVCETDITVTERTPTYSVMVYVVRVDTALPYRTFPFATRFRLRHWSKLHVAD